MLPGGARTGGEGVPVSVVLSPALPHLPPPKKKQKQNKKRRQWGGQEGEQKEKAEFLPDHWLRGTDGRR